MRRPGVLAAIALAAVVSTAAGAGPAAGQAGERPNVVVVMTDDQTVESLRFMPKVQAQLVDRGTTFRNGFVSYALCCPSRATFLTGQYAHNHRVLSNLPPNGGFHALDHSNTLPVWLQRAGYATGLVGKYLNGYDRRASREIGVPPGWSEWYAAVQPSSNEMYDYTLNENGAEVSYGSAAADYQTDVYARKATDFVRRRAPAAEPFFLWVTPLAPHAETGQSGPRAAPRHEGAFAGEPQPKAPSYDEADVSDKPAFIRGRPQLSAQEKAETERAYRDRAESLLAVDDLVGSLVDALGDAGELERTLMVFTSDNGFFHGEHRIPRGKFRLYEEAIRVPLVLRGPGVPAGEARRQLAANVDLAPTVVDAAGASPGRRMDGRTLLPLVEDPLREPGRALLLEAFADDETNTPSPAHVGMRTSRYAYLEHGNGERELYDLKRDPFELESLHANPDYDQVREALAAALTRLRRCAGGDCRADPALRLKLRHGRGRRGCAEAPIRVRVKGADRGSVEDSVFYVDGDKARSDHSVPHARSLGGRFLRGRGRHEVRVIATTLDGTRTSLRQRVRACG